jgi:hypothetical protein
MIIDVFYTTFPRLLSAQPPARHRRFYSGPLRIDARDMLARNGHGGGGGISPPLSNGSLGTGSFTFGVEEE